ncbi:hypothetical protein YC2023_006915 [Brassica napus]
MRVNAAAAAAVVRVGRCSEAFSKLFSGGPLSLRADHRGGRNYWVLTLADDADWVGSWDNAGEKEGTQDERKSIQRKTNVSKLESIPESKVLVTLDPNLTFYSSIHTVTKTNTHYGI